MNKQKFLNHWMLETKTKVGCGLLTHYSNTTTNTEFNYNYSNVFQVLDYFPKVNDLAIDPGNTHCKYGETDLMEISCKGTQLSAYYSNENYQTYGCDQSNHKNGCIPLGTIRVTIKFDQGLFIDHPNFDTEVYFDDGANTIIPTYYYVQQTNTECTNLCNAMNYYFYFEMGPTLLAMLENGKFKVMIRSCCPTTDPSSKAEILFHLLPRPSLSCDKLNYPPVYNTIEPTLPVNSTAAFLPLSSKEHNYFVHCPGCVTPGILTQDYHTDRISYGLKDTDNDGKADSQTSLIDANYINAMPVERKYSSWGDKIVDYTTATFQDGDPNMDGFTYAQMNNVNNGTIGKFNFIQCERKFPHALTIVNLVPVKLSFFVDRAGSGAIVQGAGFVLPQTNYETVLWFTVSTQPDLNRYITNVPGNIPENDIYYLNFSALANELYQMVCLLQIQF
ncbi:MAG: hypothetical protein IPP29_18185 [Bacteroidetes bacterium]|nr:hypothetical protein [Bacteroidota bacterium]